MTGTPRSWPAIRIGSNGASQGILDAARLSIELAKPQPLEQSLRACEAERRPATPKIVLSNRKNDPEQVMQIAEERAPDGFTRIEDVIPRSQLEEIATRYKQLQALPSKPSRRRR